MEKFNFGNIDLSVVKTNVRTTSDDKAYVRLSETPSRFNLNALASKALGVEPQDKVMFFENKNAEDLNGLFFMGKVSKEADENVAKLYSPNKQTGEGINLAFVQASVYTKLIQGEVDAAALSPEAMEEKGLYISRPSKKYPNRRNYSSLRTMQFELVEGPAIEVDGEEVQLFALVNPKSYDLTPEESVVEEQD